MNNHKDNRTIEEVTIELHSIVVRAQEARTACLDMKAWSSADCWSGIWKRAQQAIDYTQPWIRGEK